jgi:Pyruvate/2-oxoacid:ferredoxin oxidoreductase delta subunit
MVNPGRNNTRKKPKNICNPPKIAARVSISSPGVSVSSASGFYVFTRLYKILVHRTESINCKWCLSFCLSEVLGKSHFKKSGKSTSRVFFTGKIRDFEQPKSYRSCENILNRSLKKRSAPNCYS